jgi:hypothetical protein
MMHLIENAHRRLVLIANNSAFEVLKLPWPPVAQPCTVWCRAQPILCPELSRGVAVRLYSEISNFKFEIAAVLPLLLWHSQSWLCSYELLSTHPHQTRIGSENAARLRASSCNRMNQISPPKVSPFALMARSAVLDFAERSRRKKIFCGDRRSVELRALCNDSPRTPPGPEGSNGNGSASCAAEYPKFLSSQPESVWAHGKTG